MESPILKKCRELLQAYKAGRLGQTRMPEDANPGFSLQEVEHKLAYFTLPMALNYQRDSYRLWEAALKTFTDLETNFVFEPEGVSKASPEELRQALLKHKLALQPNKHIKTWQTIANTVFENWGSFKNFISAASGDFLCFKNLVTINYKKGFPYLSGPKIFNYPRNLALFCVPRLWGV